MGCLGVRESGGVRFGDVLSAGVPALREGVTSLFLRTCHYLRGDVGWLSSPEDVACYECGWV